MRHHLCAHARASARASAHLRAVAYELRLSDGKVVKAADGSKSSTPFVMGDDEGNARAGYPPFLGQILGSVHAKSRYEVAIAAEAAYGAAGEPTLGVPADSALDMSVQVLDVYPVDELAKDGPGTLTKKTMNKGDGWMTPHVGWELHVHYTHTRADGSVVRSTRDGEPLVFTLGQEAAAGLPRVFEHVRGMKRHELAHFHASADWSGDAADGSVFDIELLNWAEVKVVPKTNDEVRTKVLDGGDGSYERPNDGATVRAHVTVRLASAATNGNAPPPLEDSTGGEPFEFVIDDDVMLPAVEMAIKDMAKGSKAELAVPPSWGYTPALAGSRGVPESAVGEPLVVLLELVSFDKAKDEWDLAADERLSMQKRKKEQGNKLFAQGRFMQALPKYEKSISVVQDHEDLFDEQTVRPEVNKMRVQCLLNKATCHLKLDEPQLALDQATKALSIDAESAKGFLRRGQAHSRMGNLAEAKADLLKARAARALRAARRWGAVAHASRVRTVAMRRVRLTAAPMCHIALRRPAVLRCSSSTRPIATRARSSS